MSSNDPKSDLPSGLAKPVQQALAAAGYTRLEPLTKVSEADLLKLHGIGRKGIDQIGRALAGQGLSFAGGDHRTE